MNAYKAKDYRTALNEWIPLAEQGHALAQNNLGFMYTKGMGVTANYAKALYYYRKAADQGLASAQFNLGFMYEKGRGVPDNSTEALIWYRLAANQGYVKAQNKLKEIETAAVAAPVVKQQPAKEMPIAQLPSVPTGPAVGPTQPTFKPDESVEVQFSGLPAAGQDWLAISGKGQGPKQYFDFIMLKNRPQDGVHRFRPLPVGEYEVRLYTNWPNGGYKIVASSKVTVASLPAQPQPVQPLPTNALPSAPQPAAPVVAVPEPAAPAASTLATAETKKTDKASTVAKTSAPLPATAETSYPAKPVLVAGSWNVLEGKFNSMEFMQKMALVEGKMTAPEGRFSGEVASGKLSGIWAISGDLASNSCSTERLGTRNWGTIEAALAADGATMSGTWGACDQSRNHVFKATRMGGHNIPAPTGTPKQKSKTVVTSNNDATPKISTATQNSGQVENRASGETKQDNAPKPVAQSKSSLSNNPKRPDEAKTVDYFVALLCKPGETAKVRAGRPVTCKTKQALDIDKAPHDGNAYHCPKGLEVRVSVDRRGVGDFTVYGFDWNSDFCVTNNRLGANIHKAAGSRLPDCTGWKATSLKSSSTFNNWLDGDISSYRCVPKNGDPIEVAITPGSGEMALCKTSYTTIWPNGGLKVCNLARPVVVPTPSGEKVKCTGQIGMSKTGFAIKCKLDKPSSFTVALPGGNGNAVCVAKKLELFPDGMLEVCHRFEKPVTVKTPKANLACMNARYDIFEGTRYLKTCGIIDAVEIRDSDGNALNCGKPDKIDFYSKQLLERIELDRTGAINLRAYKKGGKGVCQLK